MEDFIKLMIFEIIYNKLNLGNIENKFKNAKIQGKIIENPDNYPVISQYFFLLNDINFDNLSLDEKKKLEFFFNSLKSGNDKIKQSLCEFLELNLKKLLMMDDVVDFLYYGIVSDEYMGKIDEIILAFHYIEFDEKNSLTDEQFALITEEINRLENETAPNKGLKIKVMKYNEAPVVMKSEF